MRTDQSRYHVLLIGVDAYDAPINPLNGCVNDIDAIQRLLLDQANIPAAHVKRVASPHPNNEHETTIPAIPATLENIRVALTELSSEQVGADDRVFVYYAGHGGRALVEEGGRMFHRESLVASDAKLLFDIEFNYLISRIVARTPAVTIILDCCQSAGATRDISHAGGTARFVDVENTLGRESAMSSSELGEIDTSGWDVSAGMTAGVDQCQVVAACLNHELAKEEKMPGDDGVRHGYLTRAVKNALSGLNETEMKTVPWGRVWHKMRQDVETSVRDQHLWMSGNLARAVLAGPPVDGDVGLPVSRHEDNEYRIEAGTLSGITVGALLAVYGDKPFKFPPLDSADDINARVSDVLLKVTAAYRGMATAVADGVAFELPPGARARVVQVGAAEKLRCAVVPADAEVLEALAASPMLEVTSEREALACLERRDDGKWVLTDDIHGSRDGEPTLFNLGQDPAGSARAVLEHYRAYSLPIRMAERCVDLPGALRVRFLASPASARPLTEAEIVELPEVPKKSDSLYQLSEGDTFCIRVQNTSDKRLRVVLLDSAGSGRVQLLGDQIIDANDNYVFWMGNQIGVSFQASTPEGSTQCIDRLVAIGTTALGKDLKYLTINKSFQESTERLRKIVRKEKKSYVPPAEDWTATQTILRLSADIRQ